MTNNDILRSICYTLDINDSTMIEIFKLSGYEIEQQNLINLLKKEDVKGYVNCSDKIMTYFLDGLIVYKRGKQETKPGQAKKQALSLTNNIILKKLRIAMELKEENILKIFKLANIDISKPQLTALFRNPTNKHFKECGDQFLRNFLRGFTSYYRN